MIELDLESCGCPTSAHTCGEDFVGEGPTTRYAGLGCVCCVVCSATLTEADVSSDVVCERCFITAEPDTALGEAAVEMLRAIGSVVLLPFRLMRGVWRALRGG